MYMVVLGKDFDFVVNDFFLLWLHPFFGFERKIDIANVGYQYHLPCSYNLGRVQTYEG
jgi:hypothetical protein